MIYQGRVYIFGNDINTDEIIPARYLNTSDPKVLAKYCMEDARPGFAQNVEPGSIMVAGNNFGCGSSREHAPISIKESGIACVAAASFARIFFRNAVNIGLPIVECPALVNRVKEGEELQINLEEGAITLPSGEIITIPPFPAFMQAIISKGGWLSYLTSG
ncbi:MAG TPA: 3-isopropylmalate dehydratase small subunit [Spirochaetales bacterium]|nr:3-isopropylmalate dehydratase small subunit [Spirochaetales bacterium]